MKKILCIIISFISLLAIPSVVYAHFPKTDGSISVELHVDPNDKPIPGKQANLYFLFEDKEKKFQLTKCNCIISVSEQGKQIFQKQLKEKKDAHASVWGTNMPFIFPQRDVYHITISGDPTTPRTFQPFLLSWDFRVDETNLTSDSSDEPPSDPTFKYFVIGFLSIPVVVAISAFFIARKNKKEA